jgi:hypothetical protein
MEIDILDSIDQCRDLAKQALGKHAGEPDSGGFAAGSTSFSTPFGSKTATTTVKRRTD